MNPALLWTVFLTVLAMIHGKGNIQVSPSTPDNIAETEENQCVISFDGEKCVVTLTCILDPIVVHPKMAFNILLIGEIIAYCKWNLTEPPLCDPADSFTICSKRTDSLTIEVDSQTRCITSGDLVIESGHGQLLHYNIPPSDIQTSQSKPDNITKTEERTNNDTTGDDKVISIIVGVIVTAVAVACIVLAVLYKKKMWCFKERTNRRNSDDKASNNEDDECLKTENGGDKNVTRWSVLRGKWRRFLARTGHVSSTEQNPADSALTTITSHS